MTRSEESYEAEIRVLRDALEYYMTNGVDEHLYYTVKKALSQPTDDSALRAALAAERERCIENVMRVICDERCYIDVNDAVDAIRALEDK
jgi:hypothetical protein